MYGELQETQTVTRTTVRVVRTFNGVSRWDSHSSNGAFRYTTVADTTVGDLNHPLFKYYLQYFPFLECKKNKFDNFDFIFH